MPRLIGILKRAKEKKFASFVFFIFKHSRQFLLKEYYIKLFIASLSGKELRNLSKLKLFRIIES